MTNKCQHSLDWWHTLKVNISPLAIPVTAGKVIYPIRLEWREIRNAACINKISRLVVSHDRSNFPPSLSRSLAPCPANNKRWKQLCGKVKVWKLTFCDLPPSDFSTSREQRRWYPAGRPRVSPWGRRPWPPSRTERRATEVPSWHGCWSGHKPSVWRVSPLLHSASFCWGSSEPRLEQRRWSLMVGGSWRVAGAFLRGGRSKLCHGSSPQLRTGLCACLRRRCPPVSQVTRLLRLFLQTEGRFGRGGTR